MAVRSDESDVYKQSSTLSSNSFSRFAFKPKSTEPLSSINSISNHCNQSDLVNNLDDLNSEESLNFDLCFDDITNEELESACKSHEHESKKDLNIKSLDQSDFKQDKSISKKCEMEKENLNVLENFDDDVFSADFSEENFDSLCGSSNLERTVENNDTARIVRKTSNLENNVSKELKATSTEDFTDVILSDDEEFMMSFCELLDKYNDDDREVKVKQDSVSTNVQQEKTSFVQKQASHNQNETSQFVARTPFQEFASDKFSARASSTPINKRTSDSFIAHNREKRSCMESPATNKNRYSWCDSRTKKRDFPGPAGLLTDLPGEQSCLKSSTCSSSTSKLINEQELVCSQASSEDFQLQSWQNMLNCVARKSCMQLLEKFNIEMMLQKAKRKCLPKHVVARILCVMLKRFDEENYDATFRDETGQIEGKIDREVLRSYLDFFIPGTVLVLKQVTILFNILIVKQENIVSMHDCQGRSVEINDIESFTMTAVSTKTLASISASRNSSENVPRENEDLFEDDFDDYLQSFDSSNLEAKS